MASLSQRMYKAAEVLEEVSELFDFLNPDAAEWSARGLRREAEQLEDE